VIEGKVLSVEEASRFLLPMSGSGAGGGGGGPPPIVPPGLGGDDDDLNNDAVAWDAIERAMRGADDESVRSASTSKAAASAATAAGGAARGAGGWWGLWTKQLTLFGGAFDGVPLVSHISVWALALHTLLDFFIVLVPAIIAAGVALGTFAVAIQPPRTSTTGSRACTSPSTPSPPATAPSARPPSTSASCPTRWAPSTRS